MSRKFVTPSIVAALLAGAVVSGPGNGAAPERARGAAPAAHLERVMSVADRRHLLIRSGIGAAPADLVALAGLTRREGIERVVAGLRAEPVVAMPPWSDAPPPHYHAREDMTPAERRRFDRARDAELGELRGWWVREMLASDSPQTERLVLFWHDLFATSYHGTDRAALAMARQNRTFRALGVGSWETLLKAMIRDAALLDFLDNGSNRADSPNENLARELLELFTLGEGHYTQRDVVAAARALSGYATSDTRELDFRLQSWNHDDGEKVLFGERGRFDGDALVERVLARPAAARHLATRFWQAFVADGTPDADWLAAASARFRESGHDVLTLYRHTLSSEAFWADGHRGAIVRSPVDLLVGTARSLDYPKRRWHGLARDLAVLGMDLFAPPDVAGWRDGEAWVGGGMLLDRRRLVERLVVPRDGYVGAEAGRGGDGTAGPGMPRSGGTSAGAAGELTANAAAGTTAETVGEMTGEAAGAMTADMSGERRVAPSLSVRLAAEHYRGPVEWRVSLLADGRPLWRDGSRTLANGHDTERDGRLGGAADMPWRRVTIAAPPEAIARADAVAVEFLNDAAGSEGDRNLYVDGAELDGVWLDAADGRQRGDCAPEDGVDPGSLYCAGTVVMARPDPPPSAPDGSAPAWRAAAAHVRWADDEPEEERRVARIALDDASTPVGDFHRLQFSVVAEAGRAPELRVESFDCVPDCLPSWPDCAWRDARFPSARTLVFPLDGRATSAREGCHFESIGDPERALLAALGRSAAELLGDVARSARGERFAATLEALRRQVEPLVADVPGERFVVDARFARPPAPRERVVAPSVAAPTLERLHAALDADGLELVDVLLAGWSEATLAPLDARPDETPAETLARIVRHPAFQLR